MKLCKAITHYKTGVFKSQGIELSRELRLVWLRGEGANQLDVFEMSIYMNRQQGIGNSEALS